MTENIQYFRTLKFCEILFQIVYSGFRFLALLKSAIFVDTRFAKNSDEMHMSQLIVCLFESLLFSKR